MNIADLMKRIVSGEAQRPVMELGKVRKVEGNIATVSPLLGGPDVLMRLKVETSEDYGFYTVPALGSIVIFALLTPFDALLLHADKLEKLFFKANNVTIEASADGIKLNGDSLGGIVNAKELKTQVDKNSAILQSILNIINGTPVPEPGNGSPSALQATLRGVLTGKQPADLSNIENPKVQHG